MTPKQLRRASESGAAEIATSGDGATLILRGYAAVFNSPSVIYSSDKSRYVETIKPGTFRRAIAESQDVRALVDHDSRLILGRTKARTLVLREDSHGLYFEATLPDTQVARDLATNVKAGNISGNSFLGYPTADGYSTVTRSDNGVRIIEATLTDIDLQDVSVVTYPAYADTSVELMSRFRDAAKASRLAANVGFRARFAALNKG